MIEFIKYTVDGRTYELIDNGDGTWSKQLDAPSVIGNYTLQLIVSDGGNIVIIDSSDSRYDFYLNVIEQAEARTHVELYAPELIRDVLEFNVIYEADNKELDELYSSIKKFGGDLFVQTASASKILQLENFLRIKGQGTLEQRKDYLMAMFQKNTKLNETSIKTVVNTITGSDCIVTFFGADELNNPDPSFGLLRVQVLSPDTSKDYRYEDIFRALKPMTSSHIKLLVIKYFALWNDVRNNFADWQAIRAMADWQSIKNYLPPQ